MMTRISRDGSQARRRALASLQTGCLCLGLAAALALLAPALALPEPGPAKPPAQVRGEVLMLTTELIVVKSSDGMSILIPLEKEAAVDSTLKVGDRVEVSSAPDQRIISIKKLAP